ncbi:MAG: beta-lactamase family protein, partial [Pseudomonadota bacterium]|nr:beta-lactamase family protein [Pseudomonadota bacterium]
MSSALKPCVLAAALSLLIAAPMHSAKAAADPVVDQATAAPASADQPSATPRGTTFIVPGGFTQRVEGNNAVLLMPPEADGSRIAIVDAVADNADAAVAEAWKLLGMSPKLIIATDAAPRDGWEARRFYEYHVADNSKRAIGARALRKGTAWTVMLMDVDQAIAEKRSSQFGKIGQRLQPAGYARESFAGRTAHKLDAARLKQINDFVEQMRKDFDVPGVAIGIVQDGKVVMAQGFG